MTKVNKAAIEQIHRELMWTPIPDSEEACEIWLTNIIKRYLQLAETSKEKPLPMAGNL